ncbi:MAG: Na+/H+ antiporter NhaA [Spirochaetes bacterium]|nr:Na+/H+ antiporter NhaA [Spirochaetota bacterium]
MGFRYSGHMKIKRTPPTLISKRDRLPVDYLLHPFQYVTREEAFGGVLLIAATVVALVLANSPWKLLYDSMIESKFSIGFSWFGLKMSLGHWINDGLMALFFFVVGLEIKREVFVGELASVRRSALPIAAALGGMLVPAAVYLAINAGQPGMRGWGVPMATDIAFSIGALALMGKRVPLGVKVFVTALAIVDDIGAVLVIAVFYTGQLSWQPLVVCGLFLGMLVAVNRLGVRHPLVYGILGICLWVAMLKSGVHATIAGILTAVIVPSRSRINAPAFIEDNRLYMSEFKAGETGDGLVLTSKRQQAALRALETACGNVQSPMQQLEHAVLPWVRFIIMPLFAFANAGITVTGNTVFAMQHPVAIGIMAGLVFGKPAGITLFSWIAVRAGIAELPAGVAWRHLIAAAMVAGIGFTMSLFIAELAFKDTLLLDTAKIGIMLGSFIAAVAGMAVLRLVTRRQT